MIVSGWLTSFYKCLFALNVTVTCEVNDLEEFPTSCLILTCPCCTHRLGPTRFPQKKLRMPHEWPTGHIFYTQRTIMCKIWLQIFWIHLSSFPKNGAPLTVPFALRPMARLHTKNPMRRMIYQYWPIYFHTEGRHEPVKFTRQCQSPDKRLRLCQVWKTACLNNEHFVTLVSW